MARFNNKRLGPLLMMTCAAAVLPLLVQADEPSAPSVDGRVLGAAEAVIDYCAKLDPASAERYRQQFKSMIKGANEEALAKVRSSEDYKEARATTEDSLGKLDESSAKQTCSQPAAPAK
jgi:hypothetical protein